MLDLSMNDKQRADIDEIFAAYLAQDPPLTPGVAYGVVMDGVLVHTGGLGTLHVGEQHQPGADCSFRIASMTKSFVAATLLLLRDEGVLRLDDTAEQWVPELQGLPLATSDSRPPTLRQLLSMNSGYPEDDPWADRLESLSDDEYSALMGEPKTFARTSGIAFDYSNIGFTLLGRVIQNATGQPYRDVVTERIIAPLGLCDTTWSDDGVDPARLATGYALVDGEWIAQPIQSPGAFSALGGLYSTVADLAVWVAGFIDAWPPRDGDDKHPLSRASRREMQQVVTAMPLQLGAGEGFSTTLLAVMEIPGIVVGLLLAGRAANRTLSWGASLHEILVGKSILLLVGGLVLGALTGAAGYARVEPFFGALFVGILTLFLVELGTLAGRRLPDLRQAGIGLPLFALLFPILAGTLGATAGSLAGLSVGGATILAVLSASASYIAAPAAVRLALPEANPGYYLTASLGITFPFNLVIGIPLYLEISQVINR